MVARRRRSNRKEHGQHLNNLRPRATLTPRRVPSSSCQSDLGRLQFLKETNVLAKIQTRVYAYVRQKNIDITPGIPISIPYNLDTIRGLVCLLLVCFHVVGNSDLTGLRLPLTSNWHYAMKTFEFIRMPIFTVLSGFLYGRLRATSSTISTFLWKKARRIAVPLFVATTVYWLLRRLTVGEEWSFFTALFWSYQHLWYLQALIILFTFTAVTDALFMPQPIVLFVIAILLALISSIIQMLAPYLAPLEQYT